MNSTLKKGTRGSNTQNRVINCPDAQEANVSSGDTTEDH